MSREIVLMLYQGQTLIGELECGDSDLYQAGKILMLHRPSIMLRAIVQAAPGSMGVMEMPAPMPVDFLAIPTAECSLSRVTTQQTVTAYMQTRTSLALPRP